MKLFAVATFCVPMLVWNAAASAGNQQDPYKITAREKSACTADAVRLCAHTYPDEHMLLDCMKTNRTSLSAVCLVAFDAGLKRRHLQ